MTERASGTWRLRAYAGRDPLTGSPVQASRTFKGTKAAAQKALAALVAEVERRGGSPTRERITVGELLDRWLDHIESVGKARPKTVYEYRRKIDGRIRPVLGSVPLAKLDAARLDQCYAAWLADGLSPSTVRIYHAVLS